MEESKQSNQVIDVLMLAGTLLIESGSEIHRVEDTMIRIAHSQGIVDCNVLAMPVAIFFSIENANVTRMKRILRTNYNIEKVCDVNQISRQLVSGEIDLEQAYQALSELKMKRVPYTNLQLTIAATLIGAGIATVFAFAFSLVVDKYVRIPFATAFAAAFVFGFLAHIWTRYSGFPSNTDLIIAGCVMPFVPGIAMTNAVRDLMNYHLNSGMSKLFETLLITLALGAGTTVALVLMK